MVLCLHYKTHYYRYTSVTKFCACPHMSMSTASGVVFIPQNTLIQVRFSKKMHVNNFFNKFSNLPILCELRGWSFDRTLWRGNISAGSFCNSIFASFNFLGMISSDTF